jgi:hypothetical protein
MCIILAYNKKKIMNDYYGNIIIIITITEHKNEYTCIKDYIINEKDENTKQKIT